MLKVSKLAGIANTSAAAWKRERPSRCAPAKVIVIPEPPKQEVVITPAAPTPPALVDDGLRLPDMLTLPDDNQLRSAPTFKKAGDATIITSPPIE